ncbi:hypothetical protein GCM10028806_05020 [Spirosoma terrae]
MYFKPCLDSDSYSLMATTNTISSPTFRNRITNQLLAFLFLTVCFFGINGCSADKPSGSKKRIRLQVGEIKEISIPGRSGEDLQLVGTSDNQEVVDVSRPDLAPAVDTLKRTNGGPSVFQIKGITVGTANVVFSEKKATETGNGQIKRTYVVQVVSK